MKEKIYLCKKKWLKTKFYESELYNHFYDYQIEKKYLN
jgi:hypothetical protein